MKSIIYYALYPVEQIVNNLADLLDSIDEEDAYGALILFVVIAFLLFL